MTAEPAGGLLLSRQSGDRLRHPVFATPRGRLQLWWFWSTLCAQTSWLAEGSRDAALDVSAALSPDAVVLLGNSTAAKAKAAERLATSQQRLHRDAAADSSTSQRPPDDLLSSAAAGALAAQAPLAEAVAEAMEHVTGLPSRTATKLETASLLQSNASAGSKHGMASLAAVGVDLRRTSTKLGGLGIGDTMKLAAACFICVVLYKFVMSIDCASRKLDIRRCKCIARKLLDIGWDEFEGFGVRVTVHGLQDIQAKGMLGKKRFVVNVAFKWSRFVTAATNDLRWEQTKGMEVPQGASECYITLQSIGTLRNKTEATMTLETKFHMLDKPRFWGAKQKLKLESGGKHVGTLLMTFRKKGDGGGDELPLDDVDEDSSLAMELVKEYEILQDMPGFIKPAGKLQGWDKIVLLARVLEGSLRVVDTKGKEQEQCYVKCVVCNFAELQGDSMQEELAKQQKKAASKGLKELEKKCYWVWYENKSHATDEKKWHYPDGFVPMAVVSSVHRSPERDDQFILKYHSDGDKDIIIYRREGGKGLDTWTDGIDLCVNACRDLVKDKKRAAEKLQAALQRMRVMHQMFVQQNGFPQDVEQWKVWHDYFDESNYDEEYIQVLYHEVMPQR
eukprot:TRINITY_DN40462_c0_g2_i1.p1 TRINITY_DN40462_c0_g2~~TRINITY_DN40462_c0_g2_i1.p1  ORF type:complete len:618 (-),score=167.11 TRINITY_DN40462_c0_g2_i1:103-1956(-)